MKTTRKRILAIVMAVVFAFGMTTTGFAAQVDDGNTAIVGIATTPPHPANNR